MGSGLGVDEIHVIQLLLTYDLIRNNARLRKKWCSSISPHKRSNHINVFLIFLQHTLWVRFSHVEFKKI